MFAVMIIITLFAHFLKGVFIFSKYIFIFFFCAVKKAEQILYIGNQTSSLETGTYNEPYLSLANFFNILQDNETSTTLILKTQKYPYIIEGYFTLKSSKITIKLVLKFKII